MAVTKGELQVQWSAANSVSLTAGGTATSDAITFSGDSFGGSIMCKADNASTPSSGDTVDFYIQYTLGDPDGASTDEYDTAPGTWLMTLDTNGGVDPLMLTVQINTIAKGAKIYAKSNAASHSITISATIYEVKA